MLSTSRTIAVTELLRCSAASPGNTRSSPGCTSEMRQGRTARLCARSQRAGEATYVALPDTPPRDGKLWLPCAFLDPAGMLATASSVLS